MNNAKCCLCSISPLIAAKLKQKLFCDVCEKTVCLWWHLDSKYMAVYPINKAGTSLEWDPLLLVLFTLVRAGIPPADHGLFCSIDHFRPVAILWRWNWHPRECCSMPSLTCKAIPAHEHVGYWQVPVIDPSEAVWRWHRTADRQDTELTRPVAVLETSLSLQGRLYY